MNQSSHEVHTSGSRSKRSTAHARSSSSTPLGGEPARTSSFDTAASRRENVPYKDGRNVISNASSTRPVPASVKAASSPNNVGGRSNPSVSSEEPDSCTAS